MLLGLLLTLNILVCLALIGVVLLQRSEGGALGSGSPTGLITTRGVGDLLTRTTWILFALFMAISLSLTLIGGRERSSQAILNRLKLQSVNPESLATKNAASQAPGQAPGQAAPPAVQLPPLSGPAPAHAAPTGPAPAVALPPLAAPPAHAPASTPAP